MINQKQLLEYVIYPVVNEMGWDENPDKAKNAAALLLYTCRQESDGGKYIHQLGKGPARGIMQMEPNTFDDIIDNYIMYRPEVMDRINAISGTLGEPDSDELIYNMRLSVAMARVQFRRSPLAIPAWDDEDGMWTIYKKYYNSSMGAATNEEFVHNMRESTQYL